MHLETDEQIIARKERDRALEKAWRQFSRSRAYRTRQRRAKEKKVISSGVAPARKND